MHSSKDIEMKGTILFIRIIVLAAILQLVAVSKAQATDERYAAMPLRGSNGQIAKDSVCMIKDTVYERPGQVTYSVKNQITLMIDEFANIMLPDSFRVMVVMDFTFKLVGTGETSVVRDSLWVEYNKFRNYQSRSAYTYNGGYECTVAIVSVTATASSGSFASYQGVLQLHNEIIVNREYSFDPTANAVQSIAGSQGTVNDSDGCSSTGEFKVSWGKITVADEYDLEWTYIDSSAISNYYLPSTTTIDPKKIFANNASRVSIAGENYTIPLLYDNGGILFYRVRSVQVKQSGQRIAANWSSQYTYGLGVFGFAGHERSLNWQASTAFAEEGKRKSVIQYFDGSLRNRQTVTKDNSTCNTVVAETYYDFQGRPSINVMPAPTISRLIAYTPNFNRAINQPGYEKTVYDPEMTGGLNSCNDLLAGMDTASGASKYYSPANPLLALANPGFAKYIPDARNYPFTETRYTPDNTGRIAMQSGVGKEFQINQLDVDNHSHETRYFYGGADQEELDGLFGTEVGNKTHYSKVMVKDANGQYSVSYIDMHGRTIATALAGKPESKLDTLPSYTRQNITKKLIDSTNNLIDGTIIVASKNLLVTAAGSHRFQYSLLPDSINIKDCNDVNICYDCLYDLEITISNDCANPSGVPIVITRSNLSPASLVDTVCNANVLFPAVDTTIQLTEGSYTITKKLTISPTGLAQYNEIFMRRNTCKTLQQFIEEQKQLLLTTINCYPTCQACVDSLGTWEEYRGKFMQAQGIVIADTANFSEQAWLAYQAQKEACDELCDNTGLHTSIRQQMLADMTAPYGEYAQLDSAYDPHNIFYTVSGDAGLRFKQVTNPYLNEQGLPDSIINAAGIRVPPTDVSVTAAEFEANFKPTWAATLLPLHPEYCKLLVYEGYAASHIWDERFGKVQTFKEAVDSGFLNPANFSGLPETATFAYNAAHKDPFFTILEPDLQATMADQLFNFIPAIIEETTFSAWSLATIMAHCDASDACSASYTALSTAFTIDTACRGELDMAWRYFREMYLGKKAKIIDDIVKNSCLDNAILPWHNLNFPHIEPTLGLNDLANDAASGVDSLNKLIEDNCKAYAKQWWQELKPCNFTSDDSSIVVPRLIQVCKEGGDASHIFGSSTVKPGSTYTYNSFEAVIKQYCESVSKPYDTTCNAYLITAPKPYDKQPAYGPVEVWSKPDSCQCKRIGNLYQQYRQSVNTTTFAAYVYQVTGASIPAGQLDTLRKMCNDEISCKFLSAPVVLPPALQCNTASNCVSCTEFDIAFKGFTTAFPGVLPAYNDIDSVQRNRNRLFELYMNQKLGFAKTTADYLRFMDTCDISYDSDAQQQACKDLTILLTHYQQNVFNPYSPQPGTGGCDTGMIKINSAHNINYHTSTVNIGDWMYNGVLKTPFGDSTTFTPTITYKDSLCIDSSFAVEARLRFPVQEQGYKWLTTGAGSPGVQYGSYGSTRTSFNFDGNRKVVVLLANGKNWNNVFPADSIYLYVEVYLNGTQINAPSIISTGLKYLGDWATLKLQVVGAQIKVSLNDQQYASFTYGSILNSFLLMDYQPLGFDFQIDWWKMYDKKGRLRYFEDFNGCSKMGVQTMPSCSNNCAEGFVSYFNTQRSTSYSAAQIDSLYLITCGTKPEPCYNNPVGCNELKQVLADHYTLLRNNPWYDTTGVERNMWNLSVNYIANTPTRDLTKYSLKDCIENGIFKGLPDSVTLYPGDYAIQRSLLACSGNEYSFEFRSRVKPGYDATVVQMQHMISLDMGNTAVPYYTPNSSYTGLRLERSGVIVDEWNLGSLMNRDFSQWHDFRYTFKNNRFYVYIDDTLVVDRPFPGNFSGFSTFSLAGWYNVPLQYDWLKLYDGNDNLQWREDFNTPTVFAKIPFELICPSNYCASGFATYFNNRFATNYTYTQLLDLYKRQCGIYFEPCGGDAGSMLCGSIEGAFPPIGINDLSPCADSTLFSVGKGTILYNAYIDSLKNSFNNRYIQKCLGAAKTESFTVTAPISEFHYTLYYYDQAGNLVKTVPPAGVDASGMMRQDYLDSVATARANGSVKIPNHTLLTQYRYNTLGQVTAQQSPDGGQSRFWYDRLGRLVISQNANQRGVSPTEENRLYSYTKYDQLGRIAEVGQIKNIEVSEPVNQLLTRDQIGLDDWLYNRTLYRGQITQTHYDEKYAGFAGQEANTLLQRNLRNRVSYTSYTDTAALAGYQSATFYSYDLHGNVDTLLQDYGANSIKANVMNVQTSQSNRFKRMVYQYDLISGKVNNVAYQPPRENTYYSDMLYHRYSYDAENRLVLAEVSTDNIFWEKDARYEYYRHGPLARTVLGDQMVQGLDYAYTLQGWLKGVNASSLPTANNHYDMGGDGKIGAAAQYIARDVLGFNLNYFSGEYLPIGGVNPFAGHSAYLPSGQYKPLYNGNIGSMAVNIGFPSATAVQVPQLYNYTYDQLNRITGMDVYRGLDTVNNSWAGLTATTDYKERVSYDANGNILKYLRNGISAIDVNMDSLTYHYKSGTNQLRQVRDAVDGTYTEDIDNQADPNNYVYDAIGNLIADKKDSISLIKWNVYGKIAEIQRVPSVARPVSNIQYTYDAAGNRISKRVERQGSAAIEYTWYVRDASGNVMAVYNSKGTGTINSSAYSLLLGEQHLYGSNRLGILNRNISVKKVDDDAGIFNFTRGNKFFELSNHLGNVLATINDKKVQVDDGTCAYNSSTGLLEKVSGTLDGVLDYYNADVVTANDYYPFGSQMPNRKYSQTNTNYRYGFNGKENDNEVKGEGGQQDYGMRIYDPRLAKFLSIDPLSGKYPMLTPYQFASNRPIDGIDLDGGEWELYTIPGMLRLKALYITKNVYTVNVQQITVALTATSHFGDPDAGIKTTSNFLKVGDHEFCLPQGVTPQQALNELYQRRFCLNNLEWYDLNEIDSYSRICNYYMAESTMGYIQAQRDAFQESFAENFISGINTALFAAAPLQFMYEDLAMMPKGQGRSVNTLATGELSSTTRPFISVDLMGGTKSSMGKGWVNFDLAAAEGIADDVVNFGKHFDPGSVGHIVVNNPRAEFLQAVTSSVKDGGIITVRGTMSNKFFNSIYNGTATGLNKFQVIGRSENLPNLGYMTTDNKPITGQINAIMLKKINN